MDGRRGEDGRGDFCTCGIRAVFRSSCADRLHSRNESDRSESSQVIYLVTDGSSFRGSDDDLRARFEDYISAALASIKYANFLSKGRTQDVFIDNVGRAVLLW